MNPFYALFVQVCLFFPTQSSTTCTVITSLIIGVPTLVASMWFTSRYSVKIVRTHS